MSFFKYTGKEPTEEELAFYERVTGRRFDPSNVETTSAIIRQKREPSADFKLYSNVSCDEVADDGDSEPFVMPGEDEAIDEHNRRIEERKEARRQRLRPNRFLQPRNKKVIKHYPSCLQNVRHRIVPVSVGLLLYPLTCTGKPSKDNGEYRIVRYGKTEFLRSTIPPKDEKLLATGLLSNSLIHLIIFGCKYSAWMTNGYTFKNGILTIPSINSLHRDIYGDYGYSHSKFQYELGIALYALMDTSYKWRRFYGVKNSKTTKLPCIIDNFDFNQAPNGRKEISLVIKVNKTFLDLIETSKSYQTKAYRKLSLDELFYCNTTYSRRLYEMVMMDARTIKNDYMMEMDYDDFAERFGVHESMSKRPAQVLKRVQAAMDNYVSPLTGVAFDYSGRILLFINGDDVRLTQHQDLGSKDAELTYDLMTERYPEWWTGE